MSELDVMLQDVVRSLLLSWLSVLLVIFIVKTCLPLTRDSLTSFRKRWSQRLKQHEEEERSEVSNNDSEEITPEQLMTTTTRKKKTSGKNRNQSLFQESS